MWNSPVRFVEGTVYIATSVCGNRLPEALVMIKSVFIFTDTPTHFIFFTEPELRPPLEHQLKIWQSLQPNISYTFRLASYPASANESSWKLLYRPCSTLKLFLPDLLTELDAVLVLDTDVLFLRSPKGFWAHLYQMRPFQLMGLSEETPSATLGWYPNHVSAFKIYEDKGVNGGIWLMNLTRLRQHNFTREVLHIYDQYGEYIDFGDQDVVSIFYGRRPDLAYIYPCEWNYRTNHCIDAERCLSAEQVGVYLIHGIAGVFHRKSSSNYHTLAGFIHHCFQEFQLDTDARTFLLEPIQHAITQARRWTFCHQYKEVFTKAIGTPLI
ncbi:glucoside xylosyltransferase 2-like [Tachypleus tridentatus]|uniref:glucoside xylosyltransferase 2-like n=1 Tax=Tachypleus tridentatus TaxID=6853 RepID=UPI003FD3631E